MEQKNLDQIIRETVARYMKHSLIVAGNWKMNMTVREGMEFLEKLGPVDGKVMIFHRIQHWQFLQESSAGEELPMGRRISIIKTAEPIQEKFLFL